MASKPVKNETTIGTLILPDLACVTPSGDHIYILKYRFENRLRWFRIGRHGSPWTPESARREALRLLGDVAKGIDPADERVSSRHTLTFTALCDL
jgi:hypothetical protein